MHQQVFCWCFGAGVRFQLFARRITELETALDLAQGHGVAEVLASDALNQLMHGDCGVIQGGWDLGDPEGAEATMRRLAVQWKAEDVMERAESSK